MEPDPSHRNALAAWVTNLVTNLVTKVVFLQLCRQLAATDCACPPLTGLRPQRGCGWSPLQLAGPTPLLPDYSYGTWFTYWHQYSEDEAKGEVERWETDRLPLDIWALDMVRLLQRPVHQWL